MGRGDLERPTSPRCRRAGPRTTTPSRVCTRPGSTFKLITATAGAAGRCLNARASTTTTPARSRSPAARHRASTATPAASSTTTRATARGTYNISGALTVSSDAFFYNLGDLFWQQPGQVRHDADPERGDPVRRGDDHRRSTCPARHRAGSTAISTRAEAARRRPPRPSPTRHRGSPATTSRWPSARAGPSSRPIEQAVAYSTFANGGTRYAPQVASEIVDPVTGKVVKKFDPKVDRARGDLADELPAPSCQGLEGVISNQNGTAYGDFPGFPSSWNLAGKTGTASNQAGQEPNSWFVAFGPEPEPAVPRAGRHRPGRLRRPGGGAAGAQHLQLPRGQPARRSARRSRRRRRVEPAEQLATDHHHDDHRPGTAATTTTPHHGGWPRPAAPPPATEHRRRRAAERSS